jgi:hypothetical protein
VLAVQQGTVTRRCDEVLRAAMPMTAATRTAPTTARTAIGRTRRLPYIFFLTGDPFSLRRWAAMARPTDTKYYILYYNILYKMYYNNGGAS